MQESTGNTAIAVGELGPGLSVFDSCEVYGVRITVLANTTALRAALLSALPAVAPVSRRTGEAAYAVTSEESGQYALSFEGYEVVRGPELAVVLDAFRSHVQTIVAARARDFSFVHAGAVSYAGCGIVLPGPSGTGKSTLVRSLLRRGAVYYSDEYAVLDSAGRLRPFPSAIRIKDGAGGVRAASAESYGSRAGVGPERIGLVVFPTYDAGGELEMLPLDGGAAALQVLAHMPGVSTNPAVRLRAAATMTGDASCLTLRHGDSELAADRLIDAVEERRNHHANP